MNTVMNLLFQNSGATISITRMTLLRGVCAAFQTGLNVALMRHADTGIGQDVGFYSICIAITKIRT